MTAAESLNDLYQEMHRIMMQPSVGAGLPLLHGISVDSFHVFFINAVQRSLNDQSVYSRLHRLVTDPNDLILKEIRNAEDLIKAIDESSAEIDYDTVFKKNVDLCLNNLNFMSGILVDMAVLPLCKFIEWTKDFDQVISLLQFKYHSQNSDKIIDLVRLMKSTDTTIPNVIERLLKAAIKKSKNKVRKELEKELADRQRAEQTKREEEAKAMLAAEEEQRKAEESRRRAEEDARKAKEAAEKAAEEDRVRLQKEADEAEAARREAEAKAEHQAYLAQQAQAMAADAKKQLAASVKGLDFVKALLEKIKEDVAAKNFKSLQTDISSAEITYKDKNFPGLLKSLNDYVSDATFGLFIQMFDLIADVLREANTIQKNQVFNALKASLTGVSSFHQLVTKSGIIGSQQKTGYQLGSVKFESLIKLIHAYQEMGMATFIKDVREKETIERELFGQGRDSLNDSIRFLGEKIKEKEKAPAVVPRPEPGPELPKREPGKHKPDVDGKGEDAPPPLPAREDHATKALKGSLSSLKTSLQELKVKTELLQGKLVLLKDKLS
jgi:chemotaxis protein histidine kinase CheA